MTPSGLDIVFMGTPEFAVPCLHALAASRHRVRVVVTPPDRPKGRGCKLALPPVKAAALALGITVAQPESIREPGIGAILADLSPDMIVVVAYGQILPEPMLALPAFGAINLHASLLPRYRGPAPIQWAIINGDDHTGVTAMRMARGLDTGDVLGRRSTPISDTDTAASLHDRLAQLGAALMVEVADAAAQGTLTATPQDHDRATYAPLLKKADGRIDWRWPARRIERFIRGMTPWPGAHTFFGQQRLRIFGARPLDVSQEAPPGTVVQGFAEELRIACGDGALSITDIQPASGKRMSVEDFTRGCCIPPGTLLT